MSDISKIDKNFEVKTTINKDDVKFYDVENAPFKVYGVYKEDGMYRRLPEKIAKTVSEGVHFLHNQTAGGRVRFTTDSSYVAIYVKYGVARRMPHFAFSGSIGFDLYVDTTYIKTFIPPIDITDTYEGIIELDPEGMKNITINFPPYSSVKELYIGLQKTATVNEAPLYKNTKPIVYYGSSITQGGCASRPGNIYQNIISRKFNYDYINLGFSGNAKGEDEIIDYIKSLDMGLFVYDYDHNAPTPEHLRSTHEKGFKAIRAAHPELPIIMMSRPNFYLIPNHVERLEIITATYNNAVNAGDKNVYLVTGKMLTELCGNEGTVDNCHPTDYGFASMAKALCDVIENIKVI